MTGPDNALRDAVLHRLTMLEQVAENGLPESLLQLARTELHRLTDGWRVVLAVHEPGQNGRCVACPPKTLRRRRWPCRVWLMAHEHLIGEAPARTRNSKRVWSRNVRH